MSTASARIALKRGRRASPKFGTALLRRPVLRLLFVDDDAAEVQRCLNELQHTQSRIDSDPALVKAIATAGQVPGRFETVDEGQPFAVVVDYAHTPDSLENVLRAARGLTRSRLRVALSSSEPSSVVRSSDCSLDIAF